MDKDTFFGKNRLINCDGKYLDLEFPRVMGVLNITPDSFYDGDKYSTAKEAIRHVEKMIIEGADIIDIGAYSSRPGAIHISAKEEWARLSPILNLIRSKYPDVIISVDTFRAEIALKAIYEFRINMVNDISGGQLDDKTIDIIAESNIPYIVMHMSGTPHNMHNKTEYADLLKEIVEFLAKQSEILASKGVKDIIIDPGFGFSKSMDQNFNLLYNMNILKIIERPILAGISRKSMIYRYLHSKPAEALTGTIVLNTMALERGADILRVHDVKEAQETIKLFLKARQEGKNYLNKTMV